MVRDGLGLLVVLLLGGCVGPGGLEGHDGDGSSESGDDVGDTGGAGCPEAPPRSGELCRGGQCSWEDEIQCTCEIPSGHGDEGGPATGQWGCWAMLPEAADVVTVTSPVLTLLDCSVDGPPLVVGFEAQYQNPATLVEVGVEYSEVTVEIVDGYGPEYRGAIVPATVGPIDPGGALVIEHEASTVTISTADGCVLCDRLAAATFSVRLDGGERFPGGGLEHTIDFDPTPIVCP